MLDRLPGPLRRLFDWQRRCFFREEDWTIAGPAAQDAFARTVEAMSDRGLPLLLTMPKFRFNRAFVGRIADGKVAIKHRTNPLLWPIGPGSYYFSGRFRATPQGGTALRGRYRLRPTLAIMYYVYLSLGFGFLALSLLAALTGTVAWAAGAAGISVLLSGFKMLVISAAYLLLGWLHIALEKWLDARNRRAVRALLERAIAHGGT